MLYFLSARCTSSPVFDCDCILHLFPQKCKREGDDLEWPPLMLWPSSAERLFLFHVCRGLRELVGAKPLHLLTQTARRLKAPLGLSLLHKRGALQTHFHQRGRHIKHDFQLLFWGTACLMKKCSGKARRLFRSTNIKIKFPLNRAKAHASAILNRDLTTKENCYESRFYF